MKKAFVFCALFAAFVLTSSGAQAAAEMSFAYTRLPGPASNQFAVWVEDSQGRYVKTLFATRWTANGGWRLRETSIPIWVRQSGLAGLTRPQIDALAGATPSTGNLVFTWDGTNSRGQTVSQGDYVIVLEATLRWANQVVYRAPIRLGQGAASVAVSVQLSGDAGADRAMVGNVTARSFR